MGKVIIGNGDPLMTPNPVSYCGGFTRSPDNPANGKQPESLHIESLECRQDLYGKDVSIMTLLDTLMLSLSREITDGNQDTITESRNHKVCSRFNILAEKESVKWLPMKYRITPGTGYGDLQNSGRTRGTGPD